MKVIAESTWSWLLYADGERRWLAVVCGTVGLYELVSELNADERARITADPTQTEQLARAICGTPSQYRPRHQPQPLDTEAARRALAAWRTGPSSNR